MREAVVRAGTKAWFSVPFGGTDVFEFKEETSVTVEQIEGNAHWVATVGRVPGAPLGHPTILISVDSLGSAEEES